MSPDLRRGLFALALALLLLWGLAADGLRARFTADDILNLHNYWFKPPGRVIADLAVPGGAAFRPAGALLYVPLFARYRFNPWPYHAACLALLTANLLLLFAVARELAGSATEAGAASLLFAGHAYLADLYHLASTVYDLLAFLFSFLLLWCYARTRGRGQIPGAWATTGMAVLCWMALCSKEHTAALPAVLLAYELLYCGASSQIRRSFGNWLAGAGRVVAITGALSGVYLAPRLLGPAAMTANPAYRPEFRLAAYAGNLRHHLERLFYTQDRAGDAIYVALLVAALAAALALRNRGMTFAWLLFSLTSLPVLLLPPRGLFALYLPAAGIAMYLAAAGSLAARSLARRLTVSQDACYLAVTVSAMLLFVQHSREKPAASAWIAGEESTIARLMQSVEGKPEPRRGGSVAVVNCPFDPTDWTAILFLRLHYSDAALSGKWTPRSEPPAESAPFDAVFDMGEATYRPDAMRPR